MLNKQVLSDIIAYTKSEMRIIVVEKTPQRPLIERYVTIFTIA